MTFRNDTPLYYKGDREIYGLQILKFICALLIVQIHFPSGIRDILLPVTRIAVPVFFMVTGYFMPDIYGNIQKGRLKKSLLKILKIEAVAFAVYMLFFIYFFRNEPESLAYMFTGNFWLRMIIFGSTPTIHLWYLVALTQSLLLILLCVHFKVERWLYLLIPVGLLLNFLFGRYNFLVAGTVPNDLYLSRNVLTIGLPCILGGMLIRRFEHRMPSQKKIFATLLIGLLGMYTEEAILSRAFPEYEGDIIVLTIPLAIVVFAFFLQMPVTNAAGYKIAIYGRAYSLDIYLWHIVVGSLIIELLTRLGLKQTVAFDAFIAMIAAFVTAVLIKTISHRIHGKG